MDAPGDFTRGIEPRNHLAVCGEHAGLRVDRKPAHRVVDARPEAHGIELALIFKGVVEDLRLEIGIGLAGDVTVPAGELFDERRFRDLVEVGQRFDRIELLDDALFEPRLESRGRNVLDVFGRDDEHRRVTRRDDRVGTHFAVARFVHEALPRLRIDHKAVTHDRFDDLRRNAEARFVGRSPGTELNPVHMKRCRTDLLRRNQRVARRTRLVRAFELRPEARVVQASKRDVLRETAARKHDPLRRTVVDELPGVVLRENVPFAHGGTHDATVFGEDFFEARARRNGDALGLALVDQGFHELGAVSVLVGGAARDGMTAVVGEAVELDADVVAHPLVRGKRIVRDDAGELFVHEAATSEYGKTETTYDKSSALFSSEELPEQAISWMSHTDYISEAPEGFTVTAHTENCPVAAMENPERKLYAVQFHPEVNHTQQGLTMLDGFLKNVCGCTGDWTMGNYAKTAIAQIREKVGDGRVLLALSGGVDSSVCAALLSRAVGKKLTCIFVDHGFLRKNEGDEVEAAFADKDINFIRVNAKAAFMEKLNGVSDPETKRKTIGEEFIRAFERESKKLGTVDFLAQGTIYPDVIESGTGDAAVIKSHHNVGGLPDYVDFQEIIEPLRLLFKDEVRQLGIELGLPENLVWRQPFPGPGLAIRIIGEITDEKLSILQDADWIFREEIAKAGLDRSIHQYFAVLTNMRSVGVMGDGRTYDYTLALRGVTTTDFMTADFARIPYEVLEVISARIVNEVKNINRVVYDITTKPPATIEWE